MADTYQLRVTISQALADRLSHFAEVEKRKESNAVELLLSEALDLRDDKKRPLLDRALGRKNG